MQINWSDILIGAAGIVIGVYLNNYSRKIQDQKLLDELKAELDTIKSGGTSTSTSGRVIASGDIQKRQSELEGAISILQNKI